MPAQPPKTTAGVIRLSEATGSSSRGWEDAVAAAVLANGREIILPKTLIPTVGHLIFFRDTEGNVAGAMQFDPVAGDRD